MSSTETAKQDVVRQYARHAKDSGSTEVQVALITSRINSLQGHTTKFAKDHHSRLGMLRLVGKRRRLLDYLRSRDVQAYRKLIQDLGIRK